jgi:hypothetical protein
LFMIRAPFHIFINLQDPSLETATDPPYRQAQRTESHANI